MGFLRYYVLGSYSSLVLLCTLVSLSNLFLLFCKHSLVHSAHIVWFAIKDFALILLFVFGVFISIVILTVVHVQNAFLKDAAFVSQVIPTSSVYGYIR